MVKRKNLPRYKCLRPAKKLFLKKLRITQGLRKANLRLKKKILKKDLLIETLRKNNNELAKSLETCKMRKQVEPDVDKVTLLALQEKLKICAKNNTKLDNNLSNSIYPMLLKLTEDYARCKMIIKETESVLESIVPTNGIHGTNARTLYGRNRVNQVLPMVQGVGIHKPVITLRRFQINELAAGSSPIMEEGENQAVSPVGRHRRSRLGRGNFPQYNNNGLVGLIAGPSTVTSSDVNRIEADSLSATSSAVIPIENLSLAHSAANTDVNTSPLVGNEDRVSITIPVSTAITTTSPSLLATPSTTTTTTAVTKTAVSTVAVPFVSVQNICDNNNSKHQQESSNLKRKKTDDNDPLEGPSWMYCDSVTPNNKSRVQNGNKPKLPVVNSESDSDSPCFSNLTVRKKHKFSPVHKLFRVQSNLVVSDCDSSDEEINKTYSLPTVVMEPINVSGRDSCSSITNISTVTDSNHIINKTYVVNRDKDVDIENNGRGIVGESFAKENDNVANNTNSVSSSKEKLKPCFVPISQASVPVLNGSSGNSASAVVSKTLNTGLRRSPTSVNNLVVSLARTDFVQAEDKTTFDAKAKRTSEKVNNQTNKSRGKLKKLSSQDHEMTKENVPDPGKSKKRTRSPENRNRSALRDKSALKNVQFSMQLRPRNSANKNNKM